MCINKIITAVHYFLKTFYFLKEGENIFAPFPVRKA